MEKPRYQHLTLSIKQQVNYVSGQHQSNFLGLVQSYSVSQISMTCPQVCPVTLTLVHLSDTIDITLVRRLVICFVDLAFSTSTSTLLSFFLVQGPHFIPSKHKTLNQCWFHASPTS